MDGATVQARGVQVCHRRGELHVSELVDAEHLGVENTFVTFDQQVRQTDEVVDHQRRSESSQRDAGSQVRRGRREHVAPGERPRRHIQQKGGFVEFDRCRYTADRVGCPWQEPVVRAHQNDLACRECDRAARRADARVDDADHHRSGQVRNCLSEYGCTMTDVPRGTSCVMSSTRTDGAIRAMTPWQLATKPSRRP